MGRIKSKTILLIIAFIFICASVFFYPIDYSAQAMSYVAHIPSFGLYCSEKDIIVSGNEKYDLTNSELLTRQKAVENSEYRVRGDHEVEFIIPFMSSALDIPQFNVTADGRAVSGEVWYGESSLLISQGELNNSLIEEKLANVYSSVLDETIVGTLYTLLPDTDTLSITMKADKNSSVIYETTNHLSSSVNADGTHSWTFMSVPNNKSFRYFVTGENSVIDFSCSCEYTTQTMAYKDFIDSNYELREECAESDETIVTKAFIYAEANKAIQKKSYIELDDIFDSFYLTYLNAYKFKLSLDGEAIVRYTTEAAAQKNSRFDPEIYMVEHTQLGYYPTDYSIALPNAVPFIIETSHATEKNGDIYVANTTENYYFVCCASQKPYDKQAAEQPRFDKTQLTVIIICGIAGGTAVVVLTVCVISLIISKYKSKS